MTNLIDVSQAKPQTITTNTLRVPPLARYEQAIASGQFFQDSAQLQAVTALDQLWHQLVNGFDASKSALRLFRRTPRPQGLYMWGGVGRGKSWLMDNFYDSLPFRRKIRLHFNHFMKRVHNDLSQLKGQRDPLMTVADQIYAEAVVICFDEFYVSNVIDAMILGDLFGMLFDRGVTLVATSNIEPSGLYKNGIHRDRFLPAIAKLEQFCQVLNVDAGVDYRLRVLQQEQLFKSPLSPDASLWIQARFDALAGTHDVSTASLIVNDREIQTVGVVEDVLWCQFSELCLKPRSPSDFIELAKKYTTVLISDIPVLDDNINDPTRRFIYLIDEFYDRRINVIMTSVDPILDIYRGQKLAFEIQRTRSRLLEMQSSEYLEQAYIPAE